MNETSRSLRRLGYLLNANGLTDGQLLERFRAHQNDAAFEVLVRRHGPMVHGVCRRVIRNYHDAEDAFQATFLVLARKAASIAPVEMVANWLYGVAYRTARKVKAQADKLHARERSTSVPPERGAAAPASLSDLQVHLDRELNRLPDKYRAPIVLCELEGRTHKDVARLLGWPEGTLSVRLMRAKKLLANRLTGQNAGPSGGLLSALICVDSASANVPPGLLAATAKHASLFAAGPASAAGAIPAPVAGLAEGVLRSMLLAKAKAWMAALVLIGCMGTGAALSTQFLSAGVDKVKPVAPPPVFAQAHVKPKGERRDVPNDLPNVKPKETLPPGALARLGTQAFRTDRVHGSALAPDGRSLYIATSTGIHVYDVDTGLPVRHLAGTKSPVSLSNSFALSADGALLAASSADKPAQSFLLDAKTGLRIRPLDTRQLRNAVFSPDGAKLAVESEFPHPQGIRIFDVATGKEECRLAEGQEKISQVLFTPDGDTLITASRLGNSIHVSDVRSNLLLHSLHDKSAAAPLVALSPDGKTLAVSDSRDAGVPLRAISIVRLIDLARGQFRVIDAEEVPSMRHAALHYSPDGRSLLVGGALTTHVLNVASGKATAKIRSGVNAKFHFTPDSRRVLSLDQKLIRVWDVTNSQELHPPEGPTDTAQCVALSPDGSVLASVVRSVRSPIYCWNAATGKLLAKLEDDGFGPVNDKRNVCFTPDGRLVSSGQKGALRVWDVATFTETTHIKLPESKDRGSLSVASDGRTAACFVFSSKMLAPLLLRRQEPEKQSAPLFIWDLASGKLLSKRDVPAAAARELPALSPDGKTYLHLVGSDVCLSETLTGKELVQLKPNPQPPGRDVIDPNFLEGPASFAADGRTVALRVSQLRQLKDLTLNSNYQVVVFDLASGNECCRIPIEKSRIRSIALAPDGRRVAAASGLGGSLSAGIWDAATAQLLWEMPETGSEVTALAFSADGNRLVTALADTTILIWDVRASHRRDKN